MKFAVLLLVVFAVSVAVGIPRAPCKGYVRVFHGYDSNTSSPIALNVVINYGWASATGRPPINVPTLSFGQVSQWYTLSPGGFASIEAYNATSGTLVAKIPFVFGPNSAYTIGITGSFPNGATDLNSKYQSFPPTSPYVIQEEASPIHDNTWRPRLYNFVDGTTSYDLRVVGSNGKELSRASDVDARSAGSGTLVFTNAASSFNVSVTTTGSTVTVKRIVSGVTTAIETDGVVPAEYTLFSFFLYGNPLNSNRNNSFLWTTDQSTVDFATDGTTCMQFTPLLG